MPHHPPVAPEVGGYILAGGRSSRMGTDKALLELAGRPLIHHAVARLRRTCADVRILSSNPALAPYASLLPDIHSGCGPLGGLEAALTHSTHDWNLFLAVDMPFLPAAFIADWLSQWMQTEGDGARIRMFTADSRPQPGFCLLHKDVLPFLSEAILHSDFKLMRVFEAAGRELAHRSGLPPEAGLWKTPAPSMSTTTSGLLHLNKPQLATRHLWFANLNTPLDFAEAQAHIDALDT